MRRLRSCNRRRARLRPRLRITISNLPRRPRPYRNRSRHFRIEVRTARLRTALGQLGAP